MNIKSSCIPFSEDAQSRGNNFRVKIVNVSYNVIQFLASTQVEVEKNIVFFGLELVDLT